MNSQKVLAIFDRVGEIPVEGGVSLNHLPLMLHIVNWVSIGSDNGLLPVLYQAITWTYTDLLPIGPFVEFAPKCKTFHP